MGRVYAQEINTIYSILITNLSTIYRFKKKKVSISGSEVFVNAEKKKNNHTLIS